MSGSNSNLSAVERGLAIRDRLPAEGLFAGHHWRVSPGPFFLNPALAKELDSLGRVLLKFYWVVNLLYRRSVEGKQPEWIARWLDQGKPGDLIAIQRDPGLRNEVPRVIRPDLLLTEHGLSVTELDSVPGGIGLTAWLNQTYSDLGMEVIGGRDGMLKGFEGIFGSAPRVNIVVSEEAGTYRPEMAWLAAQIDESRFRIQGPGFEDFADGDAAYRFFELFDMANVKAAAKLFELAAAKRILATPPPKPIFEEKLLLALLWNRNLKNFWRQELGDSFYQRMLRLVPYTWLVDPAPIPPHAAIPELNLASWSELGGLSQKERELVLKVSGFSALGWGARGVFLGNDLPQAEWAAAVNQAIAGFAQTPYVLQRYRRPELVEAQWVDFERNAVMPMQGRARLCPYYFVTGQAESMRAQLGGVLATICPADKKIIHGMSEAVFAPCAVAATPSGGSPPGQA